MILALSMPADAARVELIVDEMIEAGLDVYWDRAEPGSPQWLETGVRAAEARAIVFFFGAAALSGSDEAVAFHAIARDGCLANKGIAVELDRGSVPADIDCTVYDLSGWRSHPSGWRRRLIGDSYTRDVIAAARYKAAGRDPMAPSAPRKLLMRQLAVVFSALALPVIGFLTFTESMIALYQGLGFADMASAQEQAAWDGREPGSCKDLRLFLSRHPEGAYANEARALLDGRSVEERETFSPTSQTLPLYAGIGDARPLAGRPAAQADAQARALEEAERVCGGLVETVGGQGLEARTQGLSYECSTIGSGTVCAADGQALCSFEEVVPRQVERCGA
ncbi:hypothetical protein [Qipengyuania sp. JC766]|uniref:hypothetical protein n=1 Tax=Qipengyuania sp. JC766 TaxID=3232139 RepID=UPI00345ACA33